MNEMQLVRDFCAEQPAPRPERLAEARAGLLAAIASTTPPVPASSGPRPAWWRARHSGRGPGLPAPRLVIGAGLAIASAAAVVVATGIPPGGSRPAVPTASAAEVLRHAATVALAQPVPQPGQFIETETRTISQSRPTTVTWTWASADGARRAASALTPCPASYDLHTVPSKLPAGWFYYGGQPYRPSCLMALPGKRLLPAPETYAGLLTLPTSPAALLAYIHAHYASIFSTRDAQADWLTWQGLTQILTDNVVVPPKLGAAIFRAAATLPGIRVLPNAVDAAGGRGIAVAMAIGAKRGQPPWLLQELIFDPVSYRFIGSQTVVANQDRLKVPAGTVFRALAVLRTAITNTAPAGPFDVQTPVTAGPGIWH
jgi:hypothetical protein